jgi:hypothetical protein
MAAARPTSSTDTSDIQRQMAQIRNQMHQEVQGAMRGAQSLTDWQGRIKSHPWVSLSVATALGYLIVPRRHVSTPTFVTVGHSIPQAESIAAFREPERKKSRWRLLGAAASLLTPVAIRVAQNYALGHIEDWLSQNPLAPRSLGNVGQPGREPIPSGPTTASSRLREYGH